MTKRDTESSSPNVFDTEASNIQLVTQRNDFKQIGNSHRDTKINIKKSPSTSPLKQNLDIYDSNTVKVRHGKSKKNNKFGRRFKITLV